MDSTAGERSALTLGATGLVGERLLDRLLESPAWRRVAVVGRRPTGRRHPKLTEHVAPLEAMDSHRDAFAVDAVFCCLGTTIRRAGSQAAFRAVDLDAVAAAARLAAGAGARQFLLVTAAGANAASRVFYNRVKGEAEAAVIASGVPGVAILRPSLLLGPRGERRPAERLAQVLGGALAPVMVGPLARLRPIPAERVAEALQRLAEEGVSGVRIVENDEIIRLSRG